MEERYLSRIGEDIFLERKNEISGKSEILMLKRETIKERVKSHYMQYG